MMKYSEITNDNIIDKMIIHNKNIYFFKILNDRLTVLKSSVSNERAKIMSFLILSQTLFVEKQVII